MTELQLYKFIHLNKVEWHKRINPETRQIDVVVFVPFWHLAEFAEICSREDEITVFLHKNTVAVWMQAICIHFGIEIGAVFEGQSYDNP